MWTLTTRNILLLPMLFQLIGRGAYVLICIKKSLLENVCDYDDCRKKYYWFLITYQWPERNLQKNDWTLHWWVYPKTPICRWTGLLWANCINFAKSSEINLVILLSLSIYINNQRIEGHAGVIVQLSLRHTFYNTTILGKFTVRHTISISIPSKNGLGQIWFYFLSVFSMILTFGPPTILIRSPDPVLRFR